MNSHRLTRFARSTALALAAWAVSSCADVSDDPRAAWLQTTLVDDNRIYLDREPALVALKFETMRRDRYAWLRGTAGQFMRDAARPDGPASHSAFATADSALVRTVGDPHPENLGTWLAGDGTLLLAFNDFDAADFRPWYLDVRRLALGWWTAADIARAEGTLTEAERDAVVEAAVRGYVDTVAALQAGDDPGELTGDRARGTIADDLFRRARRDGGIREELLEYTRLADDGRRVMRYGEVEPRVDGIPSDETEPVSPRDLAAAETVIAQWRTTLVDPDMWPDEGFRVLGVSRRLGAGVSSFANRRWYVLLDGATTDTDDDRLLELREAVDPPMLGAFAPLYDTRFATNGQRVTLHQRALLSRHDADVLAGFGNDGATSFRIIERTKYKKGFDVARLREKLGDGSWDADDVAEFARLSGAILARHHALADDARGVRGLDAIVDALGEDREAFIDETLAWLAVNAAQLDADYATFSDLLDQHGALLGYDTAPASPRSLP